MTTSFARKLFHSTLTAAFIGPATGAFGAASDYSFPKQEPQWTGTHAVLHGTQGGNEVELFCGMARDKITGQFKPRPTTNRMTKSQGESSVMYEVTRPNISLITGRTGNAASVTALIDGKTLKAISGQAHTYADGTVGIEGTPYPMKKTMFSKENFRQAAEDMQALCVAYGPKADWNPGTLPGEDQATLAYIDTLKARLIPFSDKSSLPGKQAAPTVAPTPKPISTPAVAPVTTPVSRKDKTGAKTASGTPTATSAPSEGRILPTGQVLYAEREQQAPRSNAPTTESVDRRPRSSGRLRCADLLPKGYEKEWEAYQKTQGQAQRNEIPTARFIEFEGLGVPK